MWLIKVSSSIQNMLPTEIIAHIAGYLDNPILLIRYGSYKDIKQWIEYRDDELHNVGWELYMKCNKQHDVSKKLTDLYKFIIKYNDNFFTEMTTFEAHRWRKVFCNDVIISQPDLPVDSLVCFHLRDKQEDPDLLYTKCPNLWTLAAYNNRLDLIIKFYHSSLYGFDAIQLLYIALSRSYIDIIEWCHKLPEFDHVWSNACMDVAARHGQINSLNWLHRNRNEGCSYLATINAASNGHLHVLKWLHKNAYIKNAYIESFSEHFLESAANNGRMNVIRWFAKNRPDFVEYYKFQTYKNGLHNAARNGHLKLVKWFYHSCHDIGKTNTLSQMLRLRSNCAEHDRIIRYLSQHRIGLKRKKSTTIKYLGRDILRLEENIML